MRAGLLRDVVVFQQRVRSRDSTGAEVWTWQDFRTRAASVVPLSGRRFFEANQLQTQATHTIRVRYEFGFRTDQRIKFSPEPGLFQYFEIVHIPDVNGRRQFFDIVAIQREDDGNRAAEKQ